MYPGPRRRLANLANFSSAARAALLLGAGLYCAIAIRPVLAQAPPLRPTTPRPEPLAAEAFTLDDALAFAATSAPALQAERLGVAVQRLNNEIARSAYLPRAGVQVNGQHNFRLPVSIVPDFQNPESGETQAVTFGVANTLTTTFYARQLLYDPAVIRDLRLRDPLVRAAEFAVAEILRDLRAEVSVAYYEALRAREQLDLAQGDIERLERNLRDARLRLEEGLDDKVPRLRAGIALNEARARAERATEALQTRRAQLARLIGYAGDAQELTLEYDYDDIATRAEGDARPELQPRRRAELKRLAAQREAQAIRTEFARRSWLPDVGLNYGYDFNWQDDRLEDLFGRTFRASYLGLSVVAPLFRGGARPKEVEIARTVEAQLDLRTEATVDQIELEYASAANGLDAALAALELARDSRALAEEVYEVVTLQYREGITPFLDVVIAENDLQAARTETLNAIIDAALARVDLARAAGGL